MKVCTRGGAVAPVAALLAVIALQPAAAAAQGPAQSSDLDLAGAFRGVRFDVPNHPDEAAPKAPSPTAHGSTWTVELHVGLVRSSTPTAGTGALPPIVSPFETVDHLQSPAVSSWFFGNGAQWINQELGNAELGGISAVDQFITESAGTRGRGRVFGGRLAHALTSRLDVEFVVDASSGSYALTPSALTGLQAAATSFAPAWNAVLSENLPSGSAVGVLTGTTDPGDQIFTTAAINFYSRRGRFSPYLTAGAGAVLNHGGIVANLDGTVKYQLGTFAKTEEDLVTINFTQARVEPVVVLGLGFTYDTTPRTGIRIDVRTYISPNPERTLLSAAPSTTGTPTVEDFLSAFGTNINVLQFSGVAGTPSTLSVPVSNVQTYTGTGRRAQATVLIGTFFRF